MTRGFLLGLILLAAAPMLLSRSAAAADPRIEWRTLETDHFVIVYDAPLEPVAYRVCSLAEHAHRTLVPQLANAPDEKTYIVITDRTDSANGFASVTPRNHIGLFATAPEGDSTLNDHDDWLYALVAHEYAHILHIDNISGLPRWYNFLFGKTWAPNQNAPRWMTEGLAVHQETALTSGGRARSALFDMYLRMAVLRDGPFELDAVTHVPRRWPHGNVPYLYGGHFMHWIAERYGQPAIATIAASIGGHPMPWNIGRAAREATGKNFDELYAEWAEYLEHRYELQRDAVVSHGERSGRRLTVTGQSNANPRFGPDGSLYWIASDGYHPSAIRRIPPGGDIADSEEVLQIRSLAGFDLVPGTRSILAQRGNTYRTSYSYFDLYLVDLDTGREQRLTWGARSLSPAVSPDGTRVVYAANDQSRTRLVIMPLEPGAKAEILWEGPGQFDQVYQPAWSPDGRHIAFSAWTQGGLRDILVMELATREVRRVVTDRAIDGNPRYSPDGSLITFSSDRSGIYNVYAVPATGGELRQVTSVLGGAFGHELSPDGSRLVYEGYNADGYDLYEIAVEPSAWTAAPPYVDDRPHPPMIPDGEITIIGPRPYRPVESLPPRSWEGSLTTGSAGSTLRVGIFGGDIAGIHSYSLSVAFGTGVQDVAVGAAYAYGRLWPSLSVSGGRNLRNAGGLFVDGFSRTYPEEVWSVSTSMGLPVLRRPEISGDLSFSYNVDWLRPIDDLPITVPDMEVPVLPETGRLAGMSARWSMSNVEGYTFGLGPQRGRSIALAARLDHPAVGSDWRALTVSWLWEEFHSLPWGFHVISVRQSGGIETSERRRDGLFVLGTTPNQDLVGAIRYGNRVGSTAILRGYEPGTFYGHQFHLTNVEYRIPLYDVDRGIGTFPLFFRRLHFAGLFDFGNAFDGEIDLGDFGAAVGGVLRLDASLITGGGTIEVGYARGLTEGGINDLWFLITRGI